MSHESAEVLLYQLAMLDADVIDIVALRAAKLVSGDAKKVKVVKKGELTKKLTIKGLLVTAGAKAAIEAAGGSVE
jgi:large subunit ribosomal protein L15